MSARLLRVVSLISILLGIALFAAACSLPSRETDNQQNNHSPDAASLSWHLAQLRFGRDASYGACIDPACPAVTPKTIATAAPSMALPKQKPAAAAVLNTPADHLETEEATVHFASGGRTLTSADKAKLTRLLPDMRKATRITLAGRTDSTGTDAVNQDLAAGRVGNVRRYLLTLDSSLAKVIADDATGNCCYVAPNDTPEHRRLNRRVEIAIDSSEQASPPHQP
jgi:outer membrane protein OmpA-like peptidoglycan-associated protein